MINFKIPIKKAFYNRFKLPQIFLGIRKMDLNYLYNPNNEGEKSTLTSHLSHYEIDIIVLGKN